MDPRQLSAFVNKGPKPSSRELDDIGEDDALLADDEEHNAEEEEEDAGTDMGALFSLAEQFAEEIEAAAEELSPDALENPEVDLDPEEEQILSQGFKTMDKAFQRKFMSVAKGLSFESAIQAAEHLEEEGLIANQDAVAGWLYRVAQIA